MQYFTRRAAVHFVPHIRTAASTLMLLAAAAGGSARAEAGDVWRCEDGAGRFQYTNVRSDTEGKRCIQVTREVSVVQTPPAAARPPAGGSVAGVPSVDPRTQRARDDSRRKILEDELANEQRALDKEKAALTEQEAVRFGGERNYQKVLDRLQPYQDSVAQHEKNIDALQKEIGATK
jgi:hypothetical protein